MQQKNPTISIKQSKRLTNEKNSLCQSSVYRLSTQPCFSESKNILRSNLLKPIQFHNMVPFQKRLYNRKKSYALERINNFQRKITLMNQPSERLKVTISIKQKQNILQNFHKKLKQSSRSKASNLKPAQKMMLKFERELKKIKRNQNQAFIDEIHDNKDKLQVYSVCLTQCPENQNFIKYGQGIFVICDGHGSSGRDVARFVGDHVFDKCLEKKKDGRIDKGVLLEVFSSCNRDLQFSGIDISFSGASCILAVYYDKELFVANLGDCQAVVKKQCKIEVLSNLHTPNREDQKQRIQSIGGVIRQQQTQKGKFSGPLRIWAPGRNSWGPGLPLTRSFGHKAARRYGIISQPEIQKFEHATNQHTLIIGSKNIFDSVKYETIFNIIKADTFQGKQKVCESLAQQALKKGEPQAGNEKASIFVIFA